MGKRNKEKANAEYGQFGKTSFENEPDDESPEVKIIGEKMNENDLTEGVIDDKPEPSDNAHEIAEEMQTKYGGAESVPGSDGAGTPPVQPTGSATVNIFDTVASGINNAASVVNSDPFDPNIHVTDSFGQPVKTADGGYRRKPGRKPGSGNGTTKVNVTVASPSDDSANLELKCRTAAIMATNLTLGMFQTLGGEEWEPKIDKSSGVDEPELFRQTFYEYFKATGNIDIPPWAGLLFVFGAYSLPRIGKPQTQKRLGGFVLWVRGFFGF